jgi:hypothetical protein
MAKTLLNGIRAPRSFIIVAMSSLYRVQGSGRMPSQVSSLAGS